MPEEFEYIVIRGGRIFDPSQGLDRPGTLVLASGKVQAILENGKSPANLPANSGKTLSFDATGVTISPGFIDLHCHLREPGFEDKETIASGTSAAAKGGFTTICCMPNTNPPVDSASTVEYIYRKAAEVSPVRVLPVGCISKGRKGEQLAEMGELYQAGVVGFSDDGNPVMNSALMLHALEYSTSFGLPIMDHCEDMELSRGGVMNDGTVSSYLGLKGVPAAAEEIVVTRDILLSEIARARLHIAHLSTAGSLNVVKRAKDKGLPVTCEATPHHLTMTEEWVKGYNCNAKVNPPLRTWDDVAALSAGLETGCIDAIATDHAPHTLEDKLCEFDTAASGISGLETALSCLLTLARGLSFKTVVYRLTAGPAEIIRPRQNSSPLSSRVPPGLGTLKAGAPADVAIIDPAASWKVDTRDFLSRGKNSPLAGMTLQGRVIATFAGGRMAYIAEPQRMKRNSK